ncbi:MAG: thermonuclease family protein [Planctomycetota bacterium]
MRSRYRSSWRAAALGLAVALLPLRGAAGGEPPVVAPAPPAHPEAGSRATDPLLLGVFPLAGSPVIDADTIRLSDGRSVRVRGIDAEETFKNARHREAATRDFVAYAREMRAAARRPVKFGTPMGEAAADALRRLFTGVTSVRLERDAVSDRDEDAFGRLLAHVIVERAEGPLLVAEALIRGGWAPYFVKYGRSQRFDQRFRAAQDAARAGGLGIWGREGPAHYVDYPERMAWWEERARQMDRWRALGARPDHVTLGTTDADERLAGLVGHEATVFGSLERILPDEDSPRQIAFLAHRLRRGFPVVVFDPEVWSAIDLDALASRFVTVRGTVTLYRDRPQIVVTDPAQIAFP